MGGPNSRSTRTALGGILAAGALALLWAASMAPSGRLGLTAVAGLFPMGAVLAAGRAAGLLCWGAAGILGLLVVPDKGVAVLFLGFLGLYPVVKSWIEGLRRLVLEWALKLCAFNLALSVFWFLFRGLFLPNPPQWLGDGSLILYLAGNVVFVLYDVGLTRLISALSAILARGRR